MDGVGSLVQAVHQYLVAGVAYVVRIVSVATDHRVVAGAAVENVVPVEAEQAVVLAIADNDVGEVVAVADDGGPDQREVLDIRAVEDRIVHRGEHGVGALTGRFVHDVTGVVDNVGVVSGAAVQIVYAGTAVDGVVALAAVDPVPAAATIERIVAAHAFDDVVTAESTDRVAVVVADQNVGATAAFLGWVAHRLLL